MDGEIQERNLGEFDHADLQTAVNTLLRNRQQEWKIRVVDLAREQIIRHAPPLCIEVLSPEDTFSRTQAKCRDYLAMGVPEVWIFDPEERKAYIVRDDVMIEQSTGALRLAGTPVQISIKELFEALDEE